MSSRTYLSIGDVLSLLRAEFPDVTISKIRFLESQGLVNPERSPSGYRKFYDHDVERLRWVLRQQREHFLPLKVIRDRLAAEGDAALAADDDPVSVTAERAGEAAYAGAYQSNGSTDHDDLATVASGGPSVRHGGRGGPPDKGDPPPGEVWRPAPAASLAMARAPEPPVISVAGPAAVPSAAHPPTTPDRPLPTGEDPASPVPTGEPSVPPSVPPPADAVRPLLPGLAAPPAAADVRGLEARSSDTPATGAPASGGRSVEARSSDTPATGGPASGGPATGAPATGAPATGRPASAAPAGDAPARHTPASAAPVPENPTGGALVTGAPLIDPASARSLRASGADPGTVRQGDPGHAAETGSAAHGAHAATADADPTGADRLPETGRPGPVAATGRSGPPATGRSGPAPAADEGPAPRAPSRTSDVPPPRPPATQGTTAPGGEARERVTAGPSGEVPSMRSGPTRPPAGRRGPGGPSVGATAPAVDGSGDPLGGDPSGVSLTLDELCGATGLSVTDVAALEGFALIAPMVVAGVPYFDEEALTVAKLVASFSQFGIEPRHLRLYRNAVDREVGLIEQIITPLLRQRHPEARQRASDSAAELARLGQSLRACLLRRELRGQLGN